MGLFIMLLFIVYLLACVGIYGHVCKKTGNKKIRILTIVLLVMAGFGDNIVGLSTFYYLCYTQGGQRIYKTVGNVEGYLDAWNKYGYINEYQDLVEKKYKFIEVEVNRNPEEKPLFARGEQPIRLPNGKYRYYLAKAGSPLCAYYYKKKEYYHPKVLNHRPYFKNFPKDYCMAIEPIDAFKSQYAYELIGEKTRYPLIRISRRVNKVWNINSGEVLGTATSFSYCFSWLASLVGEGMCPVCPSENNVYEPSIHLTLLHKVLKPIQP